MLRDDAIREGLMEPSEDDVKRMNLSKQELAELAVKREKVAAVKGKKTEAQAPAQAEGKDAKETKGAGK